MLTRCPHYAEAPFWRGCRRGRGGGGAGRLLARAPHVPPPFPPRRALLPPAPPPTQPPAPDSQVLLRWAAERGTPTLWSSTRADRVRSNAAAAVGWALPPPHRAAIDALDAPGASVRFHRPGAAWPDPEAGGALKASRELL